MKHTIIALALLLAACATEPVQYSNGVMTDARGMTLYTFDKDPAGRSACNGQCAKNWPPFEAPADARPSGDWSVVTRDDGTRQWAWQGKPLYRWVKDMKPGDTTGDGVNHVWRVARQPAMRASSYSSYY
jgi:predicted lipoprotein with Yx(FWY)xxD motif